MSLRARSDIGMAVLLAFAVITLGVNFLHTETGPVGRDDCPACHFLTSALSISPGVALVIPALLCQGTLARVELLRTCEADVLSRVSRAPPQA